MLIWLRRLSIAVFLVTSVGPAAAQTFESVGAQGRWHGRRVCGHCRRCIGGLLESRRPRARELLHDGRRSQHPRGQAKRAKPGVAPEHQLPLLARHAGARVVLLPTLDENGHALEVPTALLVGGQAPSGYVRVDSLVTHQAGVTFVQSLVQGVAVGTTVKLVHGVASSALVPDGDRDVLLTVPTTSAVAVRTSSTRTSV